MIPNATSCILPAAHSFFFLFLFLVVHALAIMPPIPRTVINRRRLRERKGPYGLVGPAAVSQDRPTAARRAGRGHSPHADWHRSSASTPLDALAGGRTRRRGRHRRVSVSCRCSRCRCHGRSPIPTFISSGVSVVVGVAVSSLIDCRTLSDLLGIQPWANAGCARFKTKLEHSMKKKFYFSTDDVIYLEPFCVPPSSK